MKKPDPSLNLGQREVLSRVGGGEKENEKHLLNIPWGGGCFHEEGAKEGVHPQKAKHW